jgi:hypothetical protein
MIRPKWPREVILGFPAPKPLTRSTRRRPAPEALTFPGETGLSLSRLPAFGVDEPPARMVGGASNPFANLSLSLSLFRLVEGPASPLDVPATLAEDEGIAGRRNEEGKTRFEAARV